MKINYRNNSTSILLLALPVLILFYIGLFITMFIWYPTGLDSAEWRAHILNFSVVYIFWLLAFFINQLFDLDSLRLLPRLLIRILTTSLILVVIAVVYFYFQPELLITPRRFLLVHVFVSTLGIVAWYTFMHMVMPHRVRRLILAHQTTNEEELANLVNEYKFLGFNFGGKASENTAGLRNAIVVFSLRNTSEPESLNSLYSLRHHGVRFVEFYDFYENLTHRVHLTTLTELWFLHSIDYGSHQLSDAVKRLMDIVIGFIGTVIFVILFPVIALLIKATSPGPIFFIQPRVGRNGQPFNLYKLRSMSGGAQNTWTQKNDMRITTVGKWLRKLRLDELPQFINILMGQMSMVGPRPEQVHIVEELKQQIPYYDERHMVKPGLTGWAQLHVYAGNLEETKRKLQYDLYYIKHRSFLFDWEVIFKTVYKIITFGGE